MLQPLLFLCLVMTARMLASVAAVIASSCVKMMNCGTSSGASPPGAESEAHRHSGGLQLLSSHLYQAGPTPNAMQQAASSRAARRAAEAVIGCSLVTAVLL